MNTKTKIMFLIGRTNKKTLVIGTMAIIIIAILGLGVLAACWKLKHFRSGDDVSTARSSMMAPYDKNQFILPEDAAKSGEIAVIVDNLETAKSAVVDAATKNDGKIYSTLISYSSNKIKNGSMVVQVSSENFETAFGDLKKIGKQIVQESTQQISKHNFTYPYPLASGSAELTAPSSQTSSNTASADNIATDKKAVSPAASSASIALPPYQPAVQDKGYIKVIFVDYTNGYVNNNYSGSHSNLVNMLGVGYVGQNMRNNIWVVLAIKSILLIVLLVILVIIAKKIIKNLRKTRNRPTVHVVKQASRSRAKATRTRRK
jgi:hypothetical protein